jgi:hypothetical protein
MKVMSIIICFVIFIFCQIDTRGQILLLPAPPTYMQGEGECSDIVIGAVSDHWRVARGGRLRFWAVQQLLQHDVEFHWTVTNGKLLRGQGTWEIEIKAGNKRTPGFRNATGFVTVHLQINRENENSQCIVNASNTVMIGRFVETNTQVYDLSVTPKVLRLPCSSRSEESESPLIEVSTFALSPYRDPLTYRYHVDKGRVVGEGKNVVWDLSGISPGEYRITAGVEDSACGVCRNAVTRVVKLVACESEN